MLVLEKMSICFAVELSWKEIYRSWERAYDTKIVRSKHARSNSEESP